MFGLKWGAKKKPEAHFIVARLNARMQPIDRGDIFEDPLQESLAASGIGSVTGGGTQLDDEPAGIAFCDIEISVPDCSEATVDTIRHRLEELGAPKGSKLIVEATGDEVPFGVTEGLGLFLNGTELSDDVYASTDVNHVIEECDRLMDGNGYYRGNWQGSAETALYFYGTSFDAMKAAIETFVADYPLCQKARIEQIA